MSAKRVVPTDPSNPVPADVVAILETVIEERDRAMMKWGVQTHPDGTGGIPAEMLRDAAIEDTNLAAARGEVTWKQILMEEVREAFAETDLVALDNELMQVMQVCCVWREDLRRRMAVLHGYTKVDAEEAAYKENERRNHDEQVSQALAASKEQTRAVNAARVRSAEEGFGPFNSPSLPF